MICQHYRSGCTLGLSGGNPSPGVCAICPRRTGEFVPPPDAPFPADLRDFFDAVYVLNLARRADRLRRFRQRVYQAAWGFRQPERFEAIDGQAVTPPASWPESRGAWGISLSHVGVLRHALAQGAERVLVLEDDAIFVPSFMGKAERWLRQVPTHWDALMLGGKHCSPPVGINASTVRVYTAVCMHGYAIRGRLLSDLAQYIEQTQATPQAAQCDWKFAELMPRYNVYAPTPFLIGQGRDQSDNTGMATVEQWWNTPVAPPAPPAPSPPAPIPYDEWPAHIKLIGSFRTAGERDVGQTATRLAGKAGKTFEFWFRALTGKSCGCAERRSQWAALYPYEIRTPALPMA